MDNLPIEPGTLIAGKYRVEEVIGSGAMGAVVRAQHAVLDQQVALKLMRPELMENREASMRFLREARAAAKLKSDYVARVNDVELLEDGTPVMVLEYLEGRTLEDVVQSGEKLEVTWVVDRVLEALSGLAVAHAQGVVHRDLKPSNIFLCSMPGDFERSKILDFGLSKILEDELAAKRKKSKAGQLTTASSLLGSPAYMSPEQIMEPTNVDERADIWAIGCVLHELFTGELAFDEDDLNGLILSILKDEVRPVTDVRPDVPKGLAFVVWKCMSKDRRERFSTATELMRALAPYASPRIRGSLFLADDLSFDDDFELAQTRMQESPADVQLRELGHMSTQPPAPTQPPHNPAPTPVHVPPAPPLPQIETSTAARHALHAARLPIPHAGTGIGWGTTLAITLVTAVVVGLAGWMILGAPMVAAPSAQQTAAQ